jgi:hypothetical protein
MKQSLLLLISISSLCLLSACNSSSTPPPPMATHFSVTPAANTATAGASINFTVTALDATNAVVPTYSGTVHFTSSDGQATLPADTTLSNGTGTYSAKLKTAGGQTITATATIAGTSGSITVSAAPASQLTVSAPPTATARTTFSFTVSALDPYNNPAATYSGTVHFTSSDVKTVLPKDSALPGGTGSFSATTESTGNQTITAADTVTGSINGKSNSIVTTAPAMLAITSGAPPNGTVDANYGGFRKQYEFCPRNHPCAPCSTTPFPGTCGNYPRCPHSTPCILEQDLSGFLLHGAGGVPPYVWNASSLPPGLAVTPEYGMFFIHGTPPAGSNTTYSGVQVTVNDSGTPPAQTPATYTIVISNPPPPVVNATPAPPAGGANLPYTFNFTASSGALPYQNWKETGALPAGMSPLTSGGVLSGTPTTTGQFPISVMVQDAAGQTSVSQDFTISVYPHGFVATGSMSTVRTGYTATLLGNGKVLVAGGWVPGTGPLLTAELFDPATGTFSATGSMGTARSSHTATLLNNGTVLVTGGTDSNVVFASAELYDPAAGKFTPTTGSLGTARISHTATLLNNNKVLVVGGRDTNGNPLSSAELYDPVAEKFAVTGSMTTVRESCAVTLLGNGKVLILGGTDASSNPLATAELYDPSAGTFATTGSMASQRLGPTATLLGTGKVLVTGGTDAAGNLVAIAELYDPLAGTFAATGSMVTARIDHTATLLNDGTVLLTGGDTLSSNTFTGLASAELFNPTSGTFSATGSMGTDRQYHTATLLNDGRVLVIGGFSDQTFAYIATAELYQ